MVDGQIQPGWFRDVDVWRDPGVSSQARRDRERRWMKIFPGSLRGLMRTGPGVE
jgi:hypothetical protein